jgi:hypothetical protein
LKGGETMTFDEERALKNEIDTLTKDNERKARVILGLYTIILETNDIDIIAQAGAITLDAQTDEHLNS